MIFGYIFVAVVGIFLLYLFFGRSFLEVLWVAFTLALGYLCAHGTVVFLWRVWEHVNTHP